MTVIDEILLTANFTTEGSCSYGATDALRKIADILSTHGFQLRIEAIDSSTSSEHFDHRILLESERSLTTSTIVTYVLLSFLCLVGAAIAAGLTQGMLSLNPLELKVKLETGTEAEKAAAKKILPIISEHHILLVTLMLFNACANEALPIFLDALVPSWLSIVMAVTLVLICGEIVPSAIFTGPKQLEIASFLAPLTKCLIFVLYPISYPTGWVLDAWLGHDEGITVFDRKEMAAVVDIMHSEGRLESNRNRRMTLMQSDQVNIMKGALNYIDMRVADVMSKIDDIFMLSIECSLNVETVSAIFQSGYSRIPVYEGTRDEICGLLLVKDLVFIDPEDEIPLKNFIKYFGRPIITVWGDDKLGIVLSLFKKKRSHLAIVHSVDSSREGDPVYVNIGLITLEDVIEEILGDEIEDEHDVAPHEHAFVLLHSRDMDHIRLKILGSVDVAADNAIDPRETETVTKLLKGMPEFSKNLLSHAPIEREGRTFEENLQWKIESSTVMVLRKCTPLGTAQPLPADMLYRKGRLSNASSYILEGNVIQETRMPDGKIQKVELGPGSIIAVNAVRPATSKEGSYVSEYDVYISSDVVRILRLTNLNAHKIHQRTVSSSKRVFASQKIPSFRFGGGCVQERVRSDGSSYTSLPIGPESSVYSTFNPLHSAEDTTIEDSSNIEDDVRNSV